MRSLRPCNRRPRRATVQHDIDAKAFGPAGEHMAHAVSTCVHCGFCLPACPTYRELGEEMDSPRGRILLMKSALEGALAARRRAAAHRPLPRLPRLHHRLSVRRALRRSADAVPRARGAQAGRVTRWRGCSATCCSRRCRIRRGSPGPLRLGTPRALDGAVPAGVHARDAVAGAAVGSAGADAAGPDTGARRAPGPRRAARRLRPAGAGAGHRRRGDPRPARTAASKSWCRKARAAAARWRCTSVIDDRARQHARGNVAAFPTDVDAVVTTAAGCGSGMQEYPHLFEGTADHEAATALARRTVDVSAFLAQLGVTIDATWPGADHRRLSRRLPPASRAARASPSRARCSARSATCAWSRFADSDCCGSAGTYNLDQPALAHALGQRKARAVLDTKASVGRQRQHRLPHPARDASHRDRRARRAARRPHDRADRRSPPLIEPAERDEARRAPAPPPAARDSPHDHAR